MSGSELSGSELSGSEYTAGSTSSYRHRVVEYVPFGIISLALLVAVFHLFRAAQIDDRQSAEKARVTAANHAILDEICAEMRSAVRVFERVSTTSWLTRMGIPSSAPPIGTSCLPRLAKVIGFEPETTAASRTGNAVLFAKPVRDVIVHVGGADRSIPAYRWVCYYLTVVGEGPREGAAGGLDLARFVSVPVVDADALAAAWESGAQTAPAAGRSEIAKDAPGASVHWAWRRGCRGPAGLLRVDLQRGKFVPVDAGDVLTADLDRSSHGLLSEQGKTSIATIYADPDLGVGSLGRRDSSGAGFPHGFEVQLSGSSAARRVLLHTSLVAGDSTDSEGSDIRSIVIVRDS